MPIVCIQRPNRSRPRHFTANDAARIWCYAKRAGATEEHFLFLVREKNCWDTPPDETDWREKVQDILDVLEDILEALAALLEPSKYKILKRLYQLLPRWIRHWLEGKIWDLIAKVKDLFEKVKRLPPPP